MTKHNFSASILSNALQLCNLCKTNIEADKLQDHLIEHSFENGTIFCAVCNSIFTSSTSLKNHLIEHKLSATDLKESCAKCSARFLYKSELAHHFHSHNENDDDGGNGNGETDKKSVKQEEEEDEVAQQTVKIKDEEDDDDYIEIEKLAEN